MLNLLEFNNLVKALKKIDILLKQKEELLNLDK